MNSSFITSRTDQKFDLSFEKKTTTLEPLLPLEQPSNTQDKLTDALADLCLQWAHTQLELPRPIHWNQTSDVNLGYSLIK